MGQKKSNEEVQWRGGFRVCVWGLGGWGGDLVGAQDLGM